MPRETLKQWLLNAGAMVSGGLSKKTDYVIVDENPGSRFDKARDLGIEIQDEAACLALFA